MVFNHEYKGLGRSPKKPEGLKENISRRNMILEQNFCKFLVEMPLLPLNLLITCTYTYRKLQLRIGHYLQPEVIQFTNLAIFKLPKCGEVASQAPKSNHLNMMGDAQRWTIFTVI